LFEQKEIFEKNDSEIIIKYYDQNSKDKPIIESLFTNEKQKQQRTLSKESN